NAGALHQMSLAIQPGGLLAMDLINAPQLRRDLEPYECRRVDGLTIEHRRAIEGRRVVKRTTITHPGGEVSHYSESVRIYERDELRAMIENVGLRSPRFFGDLSGNELTDDSHRMIAVAEKPG